MRLTKKFENQYYTEINYIATQKLGQLEDIEEEFGIELTKLFSVILNGCAYCKDYGYFRNCEIDLHDKKIIFCDIDPTITYEKLSDYGKTWALTKEELEK